MKQNIFINIHMIQNHSPANLNRDDLGAPKTCYFGGVLRSRISSQCLKRSIRRSEQLKELTGGIRTRRLAKLIAREYNSLEVYQDQIEEILNICGIKERQSGNNNNDEKTSQNDSQMAVYTTKKAISEMAKKMKNTIDKKTNSQNIFTMNEKNNMAREFAKTINKYIESPDMALTGRMLQPKKDEGKKKKNDEEKPEKLENIWKDLHKTVDASLQSAHAISTHEARPEVDYFVAADDVPGEDASAAYLNEAMFSSACFYKYFSIDWNQLVKNLNGNKKLAAHTVGAFLRGAALSNPSGKQNSFAAHNPPDGILVELKSTPVSYANAFADHVSRKNGRGIVEQSIAQLAQYAFDIEAGYGKPNASLWFSPNLRYTVSEIPLKTGKKNNEGKSIVGKLEIPELNSLDKLTKEIISKLSQELNIEISWEEAQNAVIEESDRLKTLLENYSKKKNEEA